MCASSLMDFSEATRPKRLVEFIRSKSAGASVCSRGSSAWPSESRVDLEPFGFEKASGQSETSLLAYQGEMT
ncbi:hypothetical protein KIL84_014915 [Mauremys mutica]|uniref:Uncharacterized protein n=1 Tax=Mauremys mutica TaxID=74926 RepID=A0A9D3XML6_9SAUR|nr:hypothetical protein KIL84_014915 [Mauremys mutica]